MFPVKRRRNTSQVLRPLKRWIVLENTGKPATPEFIDGATKTFGFWWLGTLEQIKQGQ